MFFILELCNHKPKTCKNMLILTQNNINKKLKIDIKHCFNPIQYQNLPILKYYYF